MGDSIFPPPPPQLAVPKGNKVRKFLLLGSHILVFLGGFVGGGYTPEILKGAGEILGTLGK